MTALIREFSGLEAQNLALDHLTGEEAAASPAQPEPLKVSRCLSASYEPGLSLVTACMNRNTNRVKAIKSWLAHAVVSEVVIVDWSSDKLVSESLNQAQITDPRIRIIRVEGEEKWVLSLAFNLGFRMARYDRVLKADADIIIAPDFFLKNRLAPHDLIAGNWRRAAPGQQYVNGFFYLHSADLARVNGFSEFIQTYGHDDDIYERLIAAGVRRKDVAENTVRHLDHPDEERLSPQPISFQTPQSTARQALAADTLYSTRRNRFLSLILPDWTEGWTMQPFSPDPDSPTSLRRKGMGPHPPPAPIIELAGTLAAYERLSWQVGREVFHLPQDRLDALLDRKRLSDITKETIAEDHLESFKDAPDLHLTRRVFIDAQHGLGNRLRAIASAAAIAQAEGRQLVIIWQPDHHCEARFCDLFDYDDPVIEASFPEAASGMGLDVTTYMETECGAEKGAPIQLTGQRDFYLRSAYVVAHPASTWEEENRFLGSLTPSEPVRRLLAPFHDAFDIALHIRMEGCAETDQNSYDSPQNWTADAHKEINHWRGQSHFTRFAHRLEPLLAKQKTARVFLASDMATTYEAFRDAYGDQVTALPRDCFDRSARQQQYALADMLLLARARHLLGSHWSSFTEGATRFSTCLAKTELAGIDF